MKQLCFLFGSKPENSQIQSHRETKQQNIFEKKIFENYYQKHMERKKKDYRG